MSDKHPNNRKRKAETPAPNRPEAQGVWVQSWISELASAQQALQSEEGPSQPAAAESLTQAQHTGRPGEAQHTAKQPPAATRSGCETAADAQEQPGNTASDEGPLIFAACGGVVGVRRDSDSGAFTASFANLRHGGAGQYTFERSAAHISIPSISSNTSNTGSSSRPDSQAAALVGGTAFDAASGISHPYLLFKPHPTALSLAQLDFEAMKCHILAEVEHPDVAHVRRAHCHMSNGPSCVVQLPQNKLLVVGQHPIPAAGDQPPVSQQQSKSSASNPTGSAIKGPAAGAGFAQKHQASAACAAGQPQEHPAATAWQAEIIHLHDFATAGSLHVVLSSDGACGPKDSMQAPTIILAQSPTAPQDPASAPDHMPAADGHAADTASKPDDYAAHAGQPASHPLSTMGVDDARVQEAPGSPNLIRISRSAASWVAQYAAGDGAHPGDAVTAVCAVPPLPQLSAAALMSGNRLPEPTLAVATASGQLTLWRPHWQAGKARSAAHPSGAHRGAGKLDASDDVLDADGPQQQHPRDAVLPAWGSHPRQQRLLGSQQARPTRQQQMTALPHVAHSLQYIPSQRGTIVALCSNLQRPSLVLDGPTLQQRAAIPDVQAVTVDPSGLLPSKPAQTPPALSSPNPTAQAACQLLPAVFVMEPHASEERHLRDGELVVARGLDVPLRLLPEGLRPEGEQRRHSQAGPDSLHTVVQGLRWRLDTGCQQVEDAERLFLQKTRLIASSSRLLQQLCESSWPGSHAASASGQPPRPLLAVQSVQHSFGQGRMHVRVCIGLDNHTHIYAIRSAQLLLTSSEFALSGETAVAVDVAAGLAVLTATADIGSLPQRGGAQGGSRVDVSVAVPVSPLHPVPGDIPGLASGDFHIQQVGSFTAHRSQLLRSCAAHLPALPAMHAGQRLSPTEPSPQPMQHDVHPSPAVAPETTNLIKVEAGTGAPLPHQLLHQEQQGQRAKQEMPPDTACSVQLLLSWQDEKQMLLEAVVEALHRHLGMETISQAGDVAHLGGPSGSIRLRQYGSQFVEATVCAGSQGQLDMLAECLGPVLADSQAGEVVVEPSPVSHAAIGAMERAIAALSLELEAGIDWIEKELAQLPGLGPGDATAAAALEPGVKEELSDVYNQVLAMQSSTARSMVACLQ